MARRVFDPKFISRLQTYVRYVLTKMGLSEWVVTVSDEPCEPDAVAEISMPFGQYRATLQINPDFPSRNPWERRQTVCHELAHIILSPLQALMEDLEEVLPKEAFDLHKAAFVRELEFAIERIANMYAPLIGTMEEFEDSVAEPLAA